MNIEISIGKLAEIIEEYKQISLENNKEVSVKDLEIYVPTPNNFSKVEYFIKKFDLPMVEINFNNGYRIKVAENHILQQQGNNIFARDLKSGSAVDHISGQIYVEKIEKIHDENCFDITIKNPHLYYDNNGLLHHNTITTAALSYSVEKYGRSIIIVPNKSLVSQTETDYRNVGLDVGVYFGERKEWGKKHTICTWQSLNNLLKDTQSGEAEFTITDFLEDVVCVMVDECFAGSSRVLTPTGYRPIKDIEPGDKVINYSENNKEFKIDTVIKQHKNLSKSNGEKMYKLEFDNGSVIEVTGNHKFLTDLGWIRADELTEKHEILTPSINTHS